MIRLPLVVFGAFLTILVGIANAHEIRPAYLQISEVGEREFHVLWKQPVVQNVPQAIEPIFPDECVLVDRTPPEAVGVFKLFNWETQCDLGTASLKIDGLTFVKTDVLVRIDLLNGDSANHVLNQERSSLDLQEAGAPVFDYFLIGVEHLVFGIDHVLFVIGLFLFIREPIALIKTITAFTISHSITLALSVMDLIKLEQGPIEAVVALSILFLARELALDESQRSRVTLGRPWIMAFLFGLLHGLGFAGALADIGLPEDQFWLSLLFFNIGIEIGQIAVILVLAVIAWFLGRLDWQKHFNNVAGWSMGCAAAYWTIDRTILLI